MDRTQTQTRKKFFQWVKTHPKAVWGFALLLLAAVCAVLTSALRSSQSERKALAQTLESQQEQLELMRAALRQEREEDEKKSLPVITNETVKQQLNVLSDLVTQEYVYTNADKWEEDVKWLFGWAVPGSNTTFVVTYDGRIIAGIDLSRVQVVVSEDRREVTVSLPASKVLVNEIPQETIDVVYLKDGLFNKFTPGDYNSFISSQKIVMEQKAINMGLLRQADDAAREAVRALLTALPGIEDGQDGYKLIIQ